MKTLTTLFFLTFVVGISNAQTKDIIKKKEVKNDTIKLKYNPKKKKFERENIKNKEITHNKDYDIIINGINTATLKPKGALKYFNLSSNTPVILQSIINAENSDQLNAPILEAKMYTTFVHKVQKFILFKEDSLYKKNIDTFLIEKNIEINAFNASTKNKKIKIFTENHIKAKDKKELIKQTQEDILKELYSIVNNKIDHLENLRELTNNFYKETIYEVKASKADSLKKHFYNTFNATNKKELIKEVSAFKYFIIAVTNVFKVRLAKMEQPSIELTVLQSYLQQIKSQIKNYNYTKAIEFIHASVEAKNYIKLESFTAKNGGLDIDLSLINTYTTDTIKKQTIDFYTKGNWSFDFTSGFFFSNKVDQGYYLEARDTLINNVRLEKPRSSDVSIGALAHFSKKYTSCFKAGFNLGASLSPFDGKTRYFLGLSAILGRKNQVAFSSGVSFTKIKELSNAVKKDVLGQYVPSFYETVPTFERVRAGFYFSITYNVVVKKKHTD